MVNRGENMPAGADNRFINIRNRISNTYNGISNVPTLYSHLDVLTNTDIIVIRDMNNWAEGLGMLDAFSTQFPNKTKHLHLYNTHLNNDLLNKIITLTTQLTITLTIEQ